MRLESVCCLRSLCAGNLYDSSVIAETECAGFAVLVVMTMGYGHKVGQFRGLREIGTKTGKSKSRRPVIVVDIGSGTTWNCQKAQEQGRRFCAGSRWLEEDGK
jgi:hypothetical protein